MWGHTKLMTVLRYVLGGAGSILICISPQGFSRKRLRERFITFASSVANVILGSCKRYPCRTHVLAGAVARTCRSGCTYLQERLHVFAFQSGPNRSCRMHCTARRDAVHCRTGCSALRGGLQCTAWKTTLFLPASRIMS